MSRDEHGRLLRVCEGGRVGQLGHARAIARCTTAYLPFWQLSVNTSFVPFRLTERRPYSARDLKGGTMSNLPTTTNRRRLTVLSAVVALAGSGVVAGNLAGAASGPSALDYAQCQNGAPGTTPV